MRSKAHGKFQSHIIKLIGSKNPNWECVLYCNYLTVFGIKTLHFYAFQLNRDGFKLIFNIFCDQLELKQLFIASPGLI